MKDKEKRNPNVEDYVLVAKSIVPKDLCKDLIIDLKKSKKNWFEHKWTQYTDEGEKTMKGDSKFELANCYMETGNHNELMGIIYKVIEGYINNFNYPWFNSWNGYSNIRYNIYKKNKTMANHCDHITSLFTGKNKGIPILSVLGALNDDYEGGEFIMFNNKKYDLKKGDIIVFPSNFMYPHRVNPVTKKIRYSFISWVW